MTSSTTEDNERAMGFVNFHRFATRKAFRIRERELFVLMRMRKSERMIAVFTKELLIAVFVMTVFVEVGRATLLHKKMLNYSSWGTSFR